MKLIIVEGLDNTGKSTVINELKTYYSIERVHSIHCEKPEKDTPENMARKQNTAYISLAKLITSWKTRYDIVIVDRCWYSEFVYGQIYRERKHDDVLNNIKDVERLLITRLGQNNINLVLLNVDDPAFSVKHEDGLSISKADINKITIEKLMFEDVFNESLINNKLNVIVNNGLDFKSKDEIFNQILKLIENK